MWCMLSVNGYLFEFGKYENDDEDEKKKHQQ